MPEEHLYIWHNPSHPNPTHPKILPLPNPQLTQLSIGQKHIIINTEAGLYGWGDNSKGQLGIDQGEENGESFVRVGARMLGGNRVVRVACGWNHTLLLDQLGEVFSAGEGKHGALGHGRGVNSYTFKPISGLTAIKTISAGRDHSLALSSLKVYGWGNSHDGQLGIPKQKICFEPQQLYIYPSSLCFAGPKYSIFVTEKGVYATGMNQLGQLGLGTKTKVKMPRKIGGVEGEVVGVWGCSGYSVLRTGDDQFYVSGTGILGQYLYPTKIKHFKNCETLLFTDQFGLMKSQTGTYYTWSSTKESPPEQNEQLNSMLIKQLIVGPKMMACHAHGTDGKQMKNNMYSRIQSCSQVPGKVNIVQKNQGMARSSIQYCYPPRPGIFQLNENSSEDYEKMRHQQRKNRKKSQAVNPNSLEQNWSARIYKDRCNGNGTGAQLNNEYTDYCTEEWGEPYSHIDQDQDADRDDEDQNIEPNSMRKRIKDQVMSPCFKRELSHSHSIQMVEQDCSGRENAIATPELNKTVSNNIMSRQNSKSILAISEDTDPQIYASGAMKTTNKDFSAKLELSNSNNEGEMARKIAFLEAQNKKKDDQLRKMRKQMIELMEVVESDIALKNIYENRSKMDFSRRKQQLREHQPEIPDTFTTNLKKLREILGKSIQSQILRMYYRLKMLQSDKKLEKFKQGLIDSLKCLRIDHRQPLESVIQQQQRQQEQQVFQSNPNRTQYRMNTISHHDHEEENSHTVSVVKQRNSFPCAGQRVRPGIDEGREKGWGRRRRRERLDQILGRIQNRRTMERMRGEEQKKIFSFDISRCDIGIPQNESQQAIQTKINTTLNINKKVIARRSQKLEIPKENLSICFKKKKVNLLVGKRLSNCKENVGQNTRSIIEELKNQREEELCRWKSEDEPAQGNF